MQIARNFVKMMTSTWLRFQFIEMRKMNCSVIQPNDIFLFSEKEICTFLTYSIKTASVQIFFKCVIDRCAFDKKMRCWHSIAGRKPCWLSVNSSVFYLKLAQLFQFNFNKSMIVSIFSCKNLHWISWCRGIFYVIY